ncbi:MAG: peptide deformylase [Spirochaetes bacterium]|nr:peptide deformylase [Spirochaetota bacterium]
MDLKLIYYNNPLLKQKIEQVKKIDEEIIKICKSMQEANYLYNGIAIAANQLGLNLAIIALTPIEPFNKDICLINPKIIEYSKEETIFEEGCLSFPDLYLKIKRPEYIIVEYELFSGKKYQIKASGLLARVLQHEIDHLNGIFFFERLPLEEQKKLEPILKNINEKYNNNKSSPY